MTEQKQNVVVPTENIRTRRKAVLAAAIGNFVEWYDFVVYGVFATVIATLFFPSEDRFVSLLAAFAVFGVSFVARPVGALVFGHYGDKLGRRNTLAVVILMMSGATFLIGIAPTYETIGILAPLLLVVARLLQGFSTGGEYGGASSFIVEYAPERRRGLYGGWMSFTMILALLVGVTLGALLTATLAEEALLSWGWRVPFLVALPLGLVGLYLRLKLDETPNFRAVQQTEEVRRAPLKEAIRMHGADIARLIGLVLLATTLGYLFIYLPTYLTEIIGISFPQALAASIVGLSFCLALIPLAAALSDRFGRKPFLVGTALGSAVLTYPAFLLLQGGFGEVLVAHLLFGSMVALFTGPMPAAFSELFPTTVRYSGLSLGYSVATSVFGGTTPFLLTLLIQVTGSPLSPAFYFIGAALVSLAAALLITETANKPLRDT